MSEFPAMAITASALCVLAASLSSAATVDLGNGFYDHGVATPISNHRGIVATADGQGRDVVLVWLFDHRGGYALLMIDAETGHAKEFETPFPPRGDCPYASLLSTRNRYYTHFASHFVEFDPTKPGFTFWHKTAPRMAMSMTEDDNGVIWSVTYPSCGVVSYDPATGKFRDYGHLNKENWAQYPRSIAADDKGWIYFSVGYTRSHIIGLDPRTGKANPMIPESERAQGDAYVYRDLDGKVYGTPRRGSKDNWYELYNGQARKIGKLPHPARKKSIITGSQSLVHRSFPSGKRLKACDLATRLLIVEDPKTGKVTELKFDYTSEGAHIMGLAVAPDNTICGGTAFPMRFFSYNPHTDKWTNRPCFGQWNTVARQGDRFFVGGYGGGFLLEWDPARPWVPTVQNKQGCNPQFLVQASPDINRPHDLLAHPDGHTLVLAGTPAYGHTGGGLLFWDRRTKTATILKHTDILPYHSTMSLVALPDGNLLGGTTTAAGTGGERKADQAELYIMDMATKRLLWHEPILPGVQTYTDMCIGPNGLVFGFADRTRFFVFDPASRKIIHQADTSKTLGPTTSHQGPRVFVTAPDGTIYILFARNIARLDPKTFAIARLASTPVSITAGGDILGDRIFFAHSSHMYSYKLPSQPAH